MQFILNHWRLIADIQYTTYNIFTFISSVISYQGGVLEFRLSDDKKYNYLLYDTIYVQRYYNGITEYYYQALSNTLKLGRSYSSFTSH